MALGTAGAQSAARVLASFIRLARWRDGLALVPDPPKSFSPARWSPRLRVHEAALPLFDVGASKTQPVPSPSALLRTFPHLQSGPGHWQNEAPPGSRRAEKLSAGLRIIGLSGIRPQRSRPVRPFLAFIDLNTHRRRETISIRRIGTAPSRSSAAPRPRPMPAYPSASARRRCASPMDPWAASAWHTRRW